jgi:hypothetical protein
MTERIPERVAEAFGGHDAFERENGAFVVTTTRFEGRVTASDTDDWAYEYTLTVRAPTLSTAVEGESVGPAVEDGWFDTFERRLADAPKSTRADVDLGEFSLTEEGGDAVATFTFEYGNSDRAPEVVKAFAEYVEGTYAEGVVPGYDYGGVVAEMLDEASSHDDRSGTPL